MSDKNMLTLGIVLAFFAGIVTTIVMLNSGFDVGLFKGSVTDAGSSAAAFSQPTATECASHAACPKGTVCKEGMCVQSERATCSQPFMLAESVEGRFVRYTECPNRCIVSGESAFCE